MLTTFWNLCADIELQICSYFSVDELFFSFYPDVIPYIFELLKKSHSNLQICLNNDEIRTVTLLSLININRIISLQISSDNIPVNIFHSVKSITLKDVSKRNNVLRQPYILPLLQRMTLIYSRDMKYQVYDALRYAFRRFNLRYLQLNLTNDYLLPPKESLGQSVSIRQFVLNASCSQLTLTILLDSLPNLRILRLRTLMDSASRADRNRPVANVWPLPASVLKVYISIEIIDLVWYHPTLQNIVILLTGLKNLKRCRLSGSMNFEALNGKIWYHLITKICPDLIRFIANMLIWSPTNAEEIKINFKQDTYFKRINFKLNSTTREEELLTLVGDYKRLVQ